MTFLLFLNAFSGPETFVMCYRVFAGEASTSQLGAGYQTCQVRFKGCLHEQRKPCRETLHDVARQRLETILMLSRDND
jgi:hypothetical protein